MNSAGSVGCVVANRLKDRETTVLLLEAYVREDCESADRMMGTCKMGTDPMTVVDPELRVYGVEGLRVVMPPSCQR